LVTAILTCNWLKVDDIILTGCCNLAQKQQKYSSKKNDASNTIFDTMYLTFVLSNISKVIHSSANWLSFY